MIINTSISISLREGDFSGGWHLYYTAKFKDPDRLFMVRRTYITEITEYLLRHLDYVEFVDEDYIKKIGEQLVKDYFNIKRKNKKTTNNSTKLNRTVNAFNKKKYEFTVEVED